MSRFSGKSDLADVIDIHGVENILERYKIYYQENILPLWVKKPEDLIPYYPYLVYLMCSEKDKGGIIRISGESYVDAAEKESIQWDLDCLLRYWRQCKRKKEAFSKEEAIKITVWPFDELPKEYQIELIDMVAELGDKATIEGLHSPMYDHYRKELFEEMVSNGWDKDRAGSWVYGWSRWQKIREHEINMLTTCE